MQDDEEMGGAAITQCVLAYVNDEGLDCAALLAAAGLSGSDIDDLLHGIRPLAAEEYVALCDLLDVPPSKFIRQ